MYKCISLILNMMLSAVCILLCPKQSFTYITISVSYINTYHNRLLYTRLDKFWRNQDVMFDWTAEITGTGDRSEFKLETVLESSI